jgi:hypothetical protein
VNPKFSFVISAGILAAFAAGCGSIRGPGIEFTAPRITGRVVNEADGLPLAGASVGRELYPARGPTGELRKGVEDLRLLQTFARCGKDGAFELPSERVALLLRIGEVPLDLRLTVQKQGFVTWQTNYFYSSLTTNSVREPRIDAGEIRLRRR